MVAARPPGRATSTCESGTSGFQHVDAVRRLPLVIEILVDEQRLAATVDVAEVLDRRRRRRSSACAPSRRRATATEPPSRSRTMPTRSVGERVVVRADDDEHVDAVAVGGLPVAPAPGRRGRAPAARRGRPGPPASVRGRCRAGRSRSPRARSARRRVPETPSSRKACSSSSCSRRGLHPACDRRRARGVPRRARRSAARAAAGGCGRAGGRCSTAATRASASPGPRVGGRAARAARRGHRRLRGRRPRSYRAALRVAQPHPLRPRVLLDRAVVGLLDQLGARVRPALAERAAQRPRSRTPSSSCPSAMAACRTSRCSCRSAPCWATAGLARRSGAA